VTFVCYIKPLLFVEDANGSASNIRWKHAA